MSLSRHHWLGLYLRGIAMGAADLVPGVSGGTVAPAPWFCRPPGRSGSPLRVADDATLACRRHLSE